MSGRAASRGPVLAMLGAVALLGAGCSLLFDFDPSGSPCADASPYCLPGFYCGPAGTCIPGTEPECDPLEAYDRGDCKPVCEKDGLVRACASGELCRDGACVPAPQDRTLGARCTQDSDCDPPGVCLVPYSGATSVAASERTGFCTKPCATDDTCGGSAPKCQAYAGEGSLTTSICAPLSFLGCESEAGCPSNLTCGAYALRPVAWQAVTACRARISAGTAGAIGGACTPGIPCVNGLCIIDNASPEQRSCSTPCVGGEQGTADCRATLNSPDAVCSVVTLPGDEPSTVPNPRLRLRMCVRETPRLRGDCTGTARCAADAPYCVSFGGGTPECLPRCGEGAESVDCPGAAPRCLQGTAGALTANFCSP